MGPFVGEPSASCSEAVVLEATLEQELELCKIGIGGVAKFWEMG